MLNNTPLQKLSGYNSAIHVRIKLHKTNDVPVLKIWRADWSLKAYDWLIMIPSCNKTFKIKPIMILCDNHSMYLVESFSDHDTEILQTKLSH